MEERKPDIFESDQAFIRFVSTLLLLLGSASLVLVLLCKVFHWGLCEVRWVPLFGGYDIFSEDLAAINLPLAILIIGIGLRLPTGFGWSTCVVLLWILMSLFGFISYWLSTELSDYYARIADNQLFAADYPILESIAVNAGLAILCFLGLIYLLQPPVRRLYWGKKQAPY
ncbi:MAG: hypothetical protein OHK0039_34660 [Bacteroidia bacterium]